MQPRPFHYKTTMLHRPWKARRPGIRVCLHVPRQAASGVAEEVVETPSAKLRMAFQTLGLEQEGCTPEAIRKAYITLAKKYHPDSTTLEADTDKFVSVRDAYHVCMSYAKNVSLTNQIHRALEEELQSIDRSLGFQKHRRVSHRMYLQYDGVGTGTFSEREKAYTQQRLNQTRDSVFNKKFQDALADNDSKEVGMYSPWPKSTQVTNSLERIANQMIRDSIQRGEFSNLPGRGQPIKVTPNNPMLSTMEEKINVMIGNSGFAPDWIMLEKEIRTKTQELKKQILEAWNWCGPFPMSHSKSLEWERNLVTFQEEVKDINKKIRDRNLKGPLTGQRVHITLANLVSHTIAGHVPVRMSTGDRVVQPSTPDTDNIAFLGVTGLFVALVVLWGMYR